ncbi:MAG: hypothetical protein NC314_11295 [Roseburia sp.]|nr:hypothetical protein [Roseburia sp.]MCM1243416.1 hypothetical protein [Roseburia sp.]
MKSLKNKLKSVEGESKNFVKAIGAGIFNETTQQDMSELENQKHLLKDQIEAEELREKYDIRLSQKLCNKVLRYVGLEETIA